MRIWFFDIDAMLSRDMADCSEAIMHPECDAILNRIAGIASDQVVIMSNRNIYDIAGSITLPGVIIGGNHGIEWQLPSGLKLGLFRDYEDELIQSRMSILPELSRIGDGKGIELEDRLWSITVHIRKVDAQTWNALVKKISMWSMKHGLTTNCGADRIDIHLIPGYNKSFGISYIARMFDFTPISDTVVYAGSDQSDAIAMWWTVLCGGTAIMTGRDLSVPGALFAKNQSELVQLLQNLLPD